ncbi:MAG: redoxin family protein [Chthoniobacter sp.]|uniref:redoxin family protein n=1 Tax=Chthoniobacter sp. TaxID=2510640 RepID=UPI0032A79EBD
MRFRFLIPGLATFGVAAFLLHTASADEIADKFQQFDTNHDGVLSGDELNASPILRQLDLNGDGQVTLDEAREGMAKMRNGVVAKLQEKLGGGGADGKLAVEFVFKRLDKNGDGQLTPDELTDKTWFEKLDVNKDGAVTLAEAEQVLGKTIARRALERGLPQTASFTEADMASFQEQPLLVKAGDRGVGRRVDNLTVKGLDGHDVAITAAKGDKALVLALFSATCPISNKLGPELARLEKDYAGKNIAFYLVNIAPETKPDELHKFITAFGLKSPVVTDSAQAAQRALAATTSTEVFVLDAARTLVYRGAINDQYGLGYSKDAPTKNYLRDALDSVLQDKAPAIAATSAPGCALDVPNAARPAATNLTYNHDISRILQANCVSCHHQDSIAPFSLETYADVKEHAAMMKKQVNRGAMPPWFAVETAGHAHQWMNDRSLSETDKTDLLAWLNSERPQGNPADAPVPRHFTSGWMIGQPDAVFQIPRPVQVKAEGVMPYQTEVVETNFTEDRWVRGYEILPTDRAVVHHVIVRVHAKGAKLKEAGDASEGFFAAYVPGNSFRVLPDGFAKLLPAGSRISFQIHYTPNGHATQDQIKIGLLFAAQPPQYEVHVSSLAKPGLNIPPGDANHVETAEMVIPTNMMFMSFMPHMHVRGKAFKYELTTPDGKSEALLDIPHYDFNWQIQYQYAQPKFIPAGSKVRITAIYDNSPGNPANPDPTKTVRWGQQTYEEMMIGYVEHFTPRSTTKVAQQ